VIRLGDGTDESHARMQKAIDRLWPYTGEFFAADAVELDLIERGIAADARALRDPGWRRYTGCSTRPR
jgi:ring-1,2-phenylacetyl-CoA epoxidase subunit PaaC